MPKQRLKLHDYSTQFPMTMNAGMLSPIFGRCSALAGRAWKRVLHNAQIALMLVEASRQGALPLMVEIVRGWGYVLDDAGRLWVIHPEAEFEG